MITLTPQEIAALGAVALMGGQQTDQGKTTAAKNLTHFLVSLGVDAKHIMVDKPENPSDGEDARVSTSTADLKKLMSTFASGGPTFMPILDLGGHASERYMEFDASFGNEMQGEIKLFILPVMLSTKEATILATIERFINLGAAADRIVVVFNRVTGQVEMDDLPTKFPLLRATAKTLGFRICSEPIFGWEVIAESRGTDTNLFKLASLDKTAIVAQRNAARAAGDDAEFDRLQAINLDCAAAIKPVENFTRVFTEVLGLK